MTDKQTQPTATDSPDTATAIAAKVEEVLGSVHTNNMPDMLRKLRTSLMITTYQAGKLVFVRPDGEHLNTHYRNFERPMGLAADAERIALGLAHEIIEFRNTPAVAPRLHDPPRHDGVFLPRRTHVTGHIDIHEMAWDGDGELWFVNTLFSCLCTLDDQSSFVPRWRPWFVSHYALEDRCHLNGLGMRDGKPRYVTALGKTNAREGWRANKRDGGILMDTVENLIVADKLSMPHSPRWYDGRLWVLESGRGALCTIDPNTGKKTDVARVPGFARGLTFVGPVAFIGLSQLRESNPFTDIPITDDNIERASGVWAIHIETGNTIGLLKFTGAVEEIFAVEALPDMTYPDIVTDRKFLASTYALPDEALRQTQAPAPAAKDETTPDVALEIPPSGYGAD